MRDCTYKHISDVELREADQLKLLTLDPPAKFRISGRIWSLYMLIDLVIFCL